MTLSDHARRRLAQAVASQGAGDEIIDTIDAASGISAAEFAYIDGVTKGQALAGKALVLGDSKEIATITSATITNIDAGASGVVGSVDVFPADTAKGKLAIIKANNTNNDTTTLSVTGHAQVTTVTLGDVGLATSFILQSTLQITAAEADVLDGAIIGTQVASKVVVADANINTGVSKVTQLHIGASGAEVEVTATPAVLNAAVAGAAGGYKLARGVAAVTGTLTVATGLTTVVAVIATAQSDIDGDTLSNVSATIGDQSGAPVAGSVILKAWKSNGDGDATEIAATDAKDINWIAIGT